MLGGRSTSTRSIAAALVVIAVAGCSTAGGSGSDAANASACKVLEAPTPEVEPDTAQPLGGPRGGRAGDRLAWVLSALDEVRVTVYLYLQPASGEDDLEALEAEIAARPGVLDTRAIGREETFEDFQELFEDQQQMLENVEPEDLPMSVRAEVEGEQVDALMAWAREGDDVYDTREPGDIGPSVLASSFTKQAQRDAWAELAAGLGAIDGDPAWASTSAATIDLMLEEGIDASVEDPAALSEARQELEEILSTCEPG